MANFLRKNLNFLWCRLAWSPHPPLPTWQAHRWQNMFLSSIHSLIISQQIVGTKTIWHILSFSGLYKNLTKRKLDGAVDSLQFLLKYLMVSIWCRHLNINLNLKTRFSNISYLSLNDIRWHKMSLDDIWCLVIELSPICCQIIPWERQKCLFVSLSVCLSVNLWFIEKIKVVPNCLKWQ